MLGPPKPCRLGVCDERRPVLAWARLRSLYPAEKAR